MIINTPYPINFIWCSILSPPMCQSTNCHNRYNMHRISLFENPDEPVNTISPNIQIIELCWNHHHVLFSLGTKYHLLSFLAPPNEAIVFSLAGSCSWNWSIWFSRVRLKYNKGKDDTWPWTVLSTSHSVYWTLMLSVSGMIPWLALVYSTLLSSPRCSTDVGQWNGWW